jgi:hypothetical protein
MPQDQRLAPPLLCIVDERRESSLGIRERDLPHVRFAPELVFEITRRTRRAQRS